MLPALDRLRAAGFALGIADDGGLLVRPADRLNDGQRQWLAAHKAALLAALASEQPAPPPPPPKLVARQTPEQRQQCFDARVAEFLRAGMTPEEARAATAKEGW